MKTPLWPYILRIRPRSIFHVFSLTLVLVLAMHSLTRPPQPASAFLSNASEVRPPSDERPGSDPQALDYTLVDTRSLQDPFRSPLLERMLREQRAVQPAPAPAKAPPPAAFQGTSPVTPAPPPTLKPVPVLYRGLMIRPDGTRLALVELPTLGQTAYYPEQAPLAGGMIEAIERTSLRVRTAEDSVQNLSVGVPGLLPGGEDAK